MYVINNIEVDVDMNQIQSTIQKTKKDECFIFPSETISPKSQSFAVRQQDLPCLLSRSNVHTCPTHSITDVTKEGSSGKVGRKKVREHLNTGSAVLFYNGI